MASTPNILVYEFISGGGWPSGELPSGLAGEALAMLWAVLTDFHNWGMAHTLSSLDSRIHAGRLALPADEVVMVTPSNQEVVFSSLLARSDAALIIAPETEGVLARLSRMVEADDILLLGSHSTAVAIAGDKEACYQRFRLAGLPAPTTVKAGFACAQQIGDDLGYPLVIKPLDGVGCEGVCLVNERDEMAGALDVLYHATHHEEILLQKYVPGEHASVSLLVSGRSVLPLSLNGQRIESGCPFHYLGGIVPLNHAARARAFELAKSAVCSIPGLQGYVGVDIILGADQEWLVEINPRITTSYIGLRRVLDLNLAEAIWNAGSQGVLPESIELSGQVAFNKGDPIALLEIGNRVYQKGEETI